MIKDKVPNVRLNLLKTFDSIQNKLDRQVVQNFKQQSACLLKDQDADVKYFAEKFLKQ